MLFSGAEAQSYERQHSSPCEPGVATDCHVGMRPALLHTLICQVQPEIQIFIQILHFLNIDN